MLKNLLGPARFVRGDKREGQATTRGGISWESVLSILWKEVVRPILHECAEFLGMCMSLRYMNPQQLDSFILVSWEICHTL